jgi:hypothetical protein
MRATTVGVPTREEGGPHDDGVDAFLCGRSNVGGHTSSGYLADEHQVSEILLRALSDEELRVELERALLFFPSAPTTV